jgi:hypothetical protein
MQDERALRRPVFVEGTSVVLADGQSWSLPERRRDRDDPEYDGMLRMILEAEDVAERLRSELALTIFLLSRNYELSPEHYRTLLGFESGDPALATLQRDVHALVVAQLESLPSERTTTEVELPISDAPTFPWNLLARIRARWSFRQG